MDKPLKSSPIWVQALILTVVLVAAFVVSGQITAAINRKRDAKLLAAAGNGNGTAANGDTKIRVAA